MSSKMADFSCMVRTILSHYDIKLVITAGDQWDKALSPLQSSATPHPKRVFQQNHYAQLKKVVVYIYCIRGNDQ